MKREEANKRVGPGRKEEGGPRAVGNRIGPVKTTGTGSQGSLLSGFWLRVRPLCPGVAGRAKG